MAAAVALAALCVLGAAEDLRLDAGLVTAARTRRESYEGRRAVTIGELEAIPAIALSRGGRLRLRLDYDPSLFLLVDVSGGAPELRRASAFRDRAQVIQRARFLAEGRPDRRSTLRLGAGVAYGRDDLRSAGWSGQAVPTADRILYLDARATAAAEVLASRRSTVSLEAGAFRLGGADAVARRVLPQQDGITLEATLRRSATRRDEMAVAVTATGSRFSNGTDSALLRAVGAWRHDVSRSTAVRLGAGVAASRSETSGGDASSRAAPWAETAVRHDPPGSRVAVDGALRLEPILDASTGRVDERLGATLALRWEPWREWALGAQAYLAAIHPLDAWTALRDDGPTTRVAYVEARVGRRVGRHATLAALGWGRSQRSTQPGLPSFEQWGGALELSLTAASGREGGLPGDVRPDGARHRP